MNNRPDFECRRVYVKMNKFYILPMGIKSMKAQSSETGSMTNKELKVPVRNWLEMSTFDIDHASNHGEHAQSWESTW